MATNLERRVIATLNSMAWIGTFPNVGFGASKRGKQTLGMAIAVATVFDLTNRRNGKASFSVEPTLTAQSVQQTPDLPTL